MAGYGTRVPTIRTLPTAMLSSTALRAPDASAVTESRVMVTFGSIAAA